MLSYTKPRATVQQLLIKESLSLSTSTNVHVQNVLHRLKICRTAALGYHLYRCNDDKCGYIKYQYHSCRDRHCPNCGAIKKQEWIEARTQELLPVKYYHVVFTVPHELNSLIMGHRKVLYKLLFDASAQTLLCFAKDPKYLGATPGIISVLHKDEKQLFNFLYHKDWIVYAKAPFGGPHAVIEYLGRYTHKVAISNHRICSINDQDNTVTFTYKDYADSNKQKQMTLNAIEFIRRFQQHILPVRFTKIRTYGYLSNRNRHQRINEVLKKMKLPLHKGLVKIPLPLLMMERFGIDVTQCPCCRNKTLQLVQVYNPWKRADDG